MLNVTTYEFLGAVKDALRFAATPRNDRHHSRIRIDWDGEKLTVSAHSAIYGSSEIVHAEGADEPFVFHLSRTDAKHLGEVFKLAPGLGEAPLYLDHAGDKLSVRHFAAEPVQARQAIYLDGCAADEQDEPPSFAQVFAHVGEPATQQLMALHPVFLDGVGSAAKRRGEVPRLIPHARGVAAQVGGALTAVAVYARDDDEQTGAEETQVAMESVGASV